MRIVVVAESRKRDPQSQDEIRRRIREACQLHFDMGPDDIQLVTPGSIPRTRRGDGKPKPGEELEPHPCGVGPMAVEDYMKRPRFLKHEAGFTADQEANTAGVDFILRFESLQGDWLELCRILGISATLPWMNRR